MAEYIYSMVRARKAVGEKLILDAHASRLGISAFDLFRLAYKEMRAKDGQYGDAWNPTMFAFGCVKCKRPFMTARRDQRICGECQ